MSDLPVSRADLEFDWDEANREHIDRHQVLPEEAEQVFAHEPVEIAAQIRNDELRYLYIGETDEKRVLSVAITWRGRLARVVTAWDAKKSLKTMYLKRKEE